MSSNARIATIAATFIIASAAVIGWVRPWSDGGGSGAVQALETGEWHEALASFFDELQPGRGYSQQIEVFMRHGAAADTIRERSQGYSPERYTTTWLLAFDDDGSIARLETATLDDAGGVLHEAELNGNVMVARDHREGVPDSEREQTEPLPPHLTDVDLARETMVRSAILTVEGLLHGASEHDDLHAVEEAGTIRISGGTAIPRVSGDEGSFSIPYTADLDAASAYRVVTLDARTFQPVASEIFAVLNDGSEVLLESWIYGSYDFFLTSGGE